jgi:hypothetical protein
MLRNALRLWLSVIVGTMTLSSCTLGYKGMPDARKRATLVWANALAVANPDYRVIQEGPAAIDSKGLFNYDIEPRRPSSTSLLKYGRSPISLADPASGEPVAPELSGWRMTQILANFGDQPDAGNDDSQGSEHRKQLVETPIRIEIVVELKSPLSEREVRAMLPKVPDVIFLSRGRDGKPVSWDGSRFCNSRGFDAWCGKDRSSSLVAEFQEWVSLLEATDEKALQIYGLSLEELQEAAQDSIYGFIVSGYAKDLRPLWGDGRVRSLSIADVSISS